MFLHIFCITKQPLIKSQYLTHFVQNIARIAKVALHKLPGKSSLNVRSVCPVCPDDHDEHDYNDNHNHDNHDDQFCTFTFWVPCWSGWINIKSFSFPSDQLIEFSHLEDVGCLEYFYQMQTKLTFKLDFPVAGSFRNYCDVSIVHWWTGGIEIKGIAGVVSNLICIWDAIQQFFFYHKNSVIHIFALRQFWIFSTFHSPLI